MIWEPQDDPVLIAANFDWLAGYHTAMHPYFSGGAYQNFSDHTQDDWQHAYYRENSARLVENKRAWDPGNLISFEESIPMEV